MLLHACPTNLYLIYWLTYHMFSSCRFLSTSHMTFSLQPKHVCYHLTSPCSLLYASLHWLDHSWVLAYCHTINTFDHFYVYRDSYILLPLLASTKATTLTTELFHFPFKPSTASFTISSWHPIFIFNPP